MPSSPADVLSGRLEIMEERHQVARANLHSRNESAADILVELRELVRGLHSKGELSRSEQRAWSGRHGGTRQDRYGDVIPGEERLEHTSADLETPQSKAGEIMNPILITPVGHVGNTRSKAAAYTPSQAVAVTVDHGIAGGQFSPGPGSLERHASGGDPAAVAAGAASSHGISDPADAPAVGGVGTHPSHRIVGFAAAATGGVVSSSHSNLAQSSRPIGTLGARLAEADLNSSWSAKQMLALQELRHALEVAD